MPAGRIVVVGAGHIGLQLMRSLSRDFELVCVDTNPENLEQARKLRGEGIQVVLGDATSRLTLDRLGVDEADAVVLSTTTETVNIEVARVLHEHFSVPRVVGIGITQKGIESLERYKVEVEWIFSVSAIGLRNRLEHKAKTALGIGVGKREILEIEVHPHSRLAHKPLAGLNPRRWKVGIIYRDNNIIIPSGSTTLRPKDRVVILGEPSVLSTVSDLLTFRFDQFPLEYGETLVVCCNHKNPEGFFEETAYLASLFPLKHLLVVHPPGKEPQFDFDAFAVQYHFEGVARVETNNSLRLKRISEALAERNWRSGLAIIPRSGLPVRSGQARDLLRELATGIAAPLVLSAGSFPYARVAVPCLTTDGMQPSLETALEMSQTLKYDIAALMVAASPYIGSEGEDAAREEMEKTLTDLDLVYRSEIERVVLQGNPIKAISAALAHYNLQVSYLGDWKSGGVLSGFLHPDVAWQLVQRSRVSSLLIPPVGLLA